MTQVEEILKRKRAEQEIKRKYMDEQWEEARKQQLQLRQSLVNFNTLVKENVEKRERAEQKIKEEGERQEKCKREVWRINTGIKRNKYWKLRVSRF